MLFLEHRISPSQPELLKVSLHSRHQRRRGKCFFMKTFAAEAFWWERKQTKVCLIENL